MIESATVNFSHRLPWTAGHQPGSLLDAFGPSINRAKAMAEMLEQSARLNVDNGTYLFDHDVINLCQSIRLELQDALALLKASDEFETQPHRSENHE